MYLNIKQLQNIELDSKGKLKSIQHLSNLKKSQKSSKIIVYQKQKTDTASQREKLSNFSIVQEPSQALIEDDSTVNILRKPYGNVLEFYHPAKIVGYGQFGTIRQMKHKESGKTCAIKSINKRKLKTKQDCKDIRREVQIMEHLNGHPNIISLLDTFEDRNYVHIVMEYCGGGELFDRIVQRGNYTEQSARDIITVILGTVRHCHSLGVMHRDIKPENFLLSNQADDAILKATDFGLSVFFDKDKMYDEVVGSPYYVAPEVLKKNYSIKADVWSCGVVLYVLLSGVPPFWGETDSQVFTQIHEAELDFESAPWPQVSDVAKDCITKMLNRDVNKRATVFEIFEHPFIRMGQDLPNKPLTDVVTNRLRNFRGHNKLKRTALRKISQFMAKNQVAGLRKWFKQIDKNDDGQITMTELQESLATKGFEAISEEEMRDLILASDIDNDGNINYQEFLAATLNHKIAITEENIKRVFQEFDTDNSGYLSLDELKEAIKVYQGGEGEQDLDQIMLEADENKDGVIDLNEFLNMMFGKGINEFDTTQQKNIQW